MIPFFVADRPISLEILKGFFLMLPDKVFGILTHAYTSTRFSEKFARFPYGTRARYMEEAEGTDEGMAKRIVKFADSGIFSKDRRVSYTLLFKRYTELNAQYGAIIDFFHDPQSTLESARKAIRIYGRGNYPFNLVGVVQGNTLDDYLKGYEALLNMGYRYIAIGGMLSRSGRSNFLGLRRDGCCEVERLVSEIKREFAPDWLFVFGVLSPKRLPLLKELGIWGADYKGWLYHYEEDYSFVVNYLKEYGIDRRDRAEIVRLLRLYGEYRRRGFKTMYNFSERDRERGRLLKEMKREIDLRLKRYGLSLQFFRIRRVRENLAAMFSDI